MKKSTVSVAAALILSLAVLLPCAYGAAKTKLDPTPALPAAPAEETAAQEIVIETAAAPETELAVETALPTEPETVPETQAALGSDTAAETSEDISKSPLMEFLDDPFSHIQTEEPDDEVHALWEQIRASDDPFSNADPYMGVLLDHSSAMPYGNEVESNGLTFTFVELVDGKAIVSERIAGSLTEGYMTMQDTIEEKTFAVIEVRRTDNAPLTEADRGIFFYYHRLVSGYKPADIVMCLTAEPYLVHLEYADDYCRHFLVDVTHMRMFADRTLALALTEHMIRLEGDVFTADKEGNLAFREGKISSPHALFYFDLPDSYADPAAVKAYENTHAIGTNLTKYR